MKKKCIFLIRNIAPEKFGGGEIYQLKIAKKLRETGFSPVIITNSQMLLQKAKEEGIKTLIPPYEKMQNWSGWRNLVLIRYIFFQRRLKRWYLNVLRKYRPVAINIQSRDDMIAGTLAAEQVGIKVLWTDHADFRNWVLWNVNVKFKNIIGKKIISLSKKVDRVIFVSERIAEETERMIYPKVLGNIAVIKNGVEDVLAKYSDVRELDDGFVFIGRVVKEKGVTELIEAFKIVKKQHNNARLNIYGDGDLNKFESLCKDCKGIKFYGQTSKPLKALADNQIFVLPSYMEGLSLSLLDAAMMKKRIIASDVDGNPEVIINNETGLLVPAKNVDKLAEAMIYMLENKKEAEKMAENARKYYEKNFDFDKIFMKKMLPLYNDKEEEE